MTRPKAFRFGSSRRKLSSNLIKRVLASKHARSLTEERLGQHQGIAEIDREGQDDRTSTAAVPSSSPPPSEHAPESRTADDVDPNTPRPENEVEEEEEEEEDNESWNHMNYEVGSSNAVTETDSETELNPATVMVKYYGTLESRLGYRVMLGGRKHFGYYAKDTDSPFPIRKALRAMEDRLMDSLNKKPGAGLVLDAGCGEGNVAMHLARHGKIRVHCIDIVDRHVLKTERNIKKRKLEESVTVENMDYHDLSSVGEKTFDSLFAMETLCHAHDLEEVLAGFYRVIKSFGKLVLYEFIQSNTVRCPQDFKSSAENFAALNHIKFVPENTLRAVMQRQQRFEDVKIEDISPHIMPLLRLLSTIASIRSLLLRKCRLERFFETWSSAAVLYEGMKMGYWKYVVVTAERNHRSQPIPVPNAHRRNQPTADQYFLNAAVYNWPRNRMQAPGWQFPWEHVFAPG